MGVTGLLQLLKPVMMDIHVSALSGKRVAVDAYVWLHKGAFTCALQLVEGKDTDAYVRYCMKRVAMLHKSGVIPVMVFDGGHLPSKECTESDRQLKRKQHRDRGMAFLRSGERAAAMDCFQKCIDIVPAMAKKLIDACQCAGIECIVAPYEADAQLAYLARTGYCDAVLTEDSDLVVFGCPRLLYKIDDSGHGVELRLPHIRADLRPSAVCFSSWPFDKIRQALILSGCDYLPSIPGVGLTKAWKLIRDYGDARNAIAVLKRTASTGKFAVDPMYERRFVQAEHTFMYQLVWDPIGQSLVPMTPYRDGLSAEDMPYAGAVLEPEVARGIATGLLDPLTSEPFPPALHASTNAAEPPAVLDSYATPSRWTAGKKGDPPPQTNKLDRYMMAAPQPPASNEPSHSSLSPGAIEDTETAQPDTRARSTVSATGKPARFPSAGFARSQSGPSRTGNAVQYNTARPSMTSKRSAALPRQIPGNTPTVASRYFKAPARAPSAPAVLTSRPTLARSTSPELLPTPSGRRLGMSGRAVLAPKVTNGKRKAEVSLDLSCFASSKASRCEASIDVVCTSRVLSERVPPSTATPLDQSVATGSNRERSNARKACAPGAENVGSVGGLLAQYARHPQS
eukprot:m.464092 g.464092  ORF g.464092 m.464092 type:complete len:625 (+) comp21615_c0_seq2:511-2385(+)